MFETDWRWVRDAHGLSAKLDNLRAGGSKRTVPQPAPVEEEASKEEITGGDGAAEACEEGEDATEGSGGGEDSGGDGSGERADGGDYEGDEGGGVSDGGVAQQREGAVGSAYVTLVKNALWRHHELIYGAYDYYCSLDSRKRSHDDVAEYDVHSMTHVSYTCPMQYIHCPIPHTVLRPTKRALPLHYPYTLPCAPCAPI